MSKGIREAFIPRPGKVFIQADYEGLELHTLSQACIKLVGFSKLGDALNSGRDPHSEVAARILSQPYDDVKRRAKEKEKTAYDARQAGKVANFGFPVGLGAKSLVSYAKKNYGVILDKNFDRAVEKAYQLKDTWLEQWPEMDLFFDYFKNLCGDGPEGGTVEQLFVKRYRGRSRYTSACSTISQGLGADVAKNAMWLVQKACYVDRNSPLFGCRPVAFVHDEIIAEAPDNDYVHEAAIELGRIMLLGSNPFLPDVPAKIEPMIMPFWSKGATPCYNEHGRLVVWSEENIKKMKDGKFKLNAADAKIIRMAA